MQINADDVDYNKVIKYITRRYGRNLKFSVCMIRSAINKAMSGNGIGFNDDLTEYNKIVGVLTNLGVLTQVGVSYIVNDWSDNAD